MESWYNRVNASTSNVWRTVSHRCICRIQFDPHTITPNHAVFDMHLVRGAPDVFEEAIALSEPVQALVGLAHSPDEAGNGERVVLAGISKVC